LHPLYGSHTTKIDLLLQSWLKETTRKAVTRGLLPLALTGAALLTAPALDQLVANNQLRNSMEHVYDPITRHTTNELLGTLWWLARRRYPVGAEYDMPTKFYTGDTRRSPLIMRSVTFPRGLPEHIQRKDEGIMLNENYIIGNGWPPHNPQATYQVSKVDGYRIAAPFNTEVVMNEGFVADRPGAYVVGPVTVNADVPREIFGMKLGYRRGSVTLSEYAILCYGVSDATCARVYNNVDRTSF